MKGEQSVLSLFGYYGFKNIGDELLLYNILLYFDEKFNNVEFRIYSYGNLVIQDRERFTYKLVKKRNLKNPINLYHLLINLAKSDCLIFPGGAVLAKSNILINSILIFFCGIVNTKVYILPVGVGSFPSNNNHWFLKFLWRKVSYVSVRDVPSFNNLDWYGEREIKPDVAFLPVPSKIENFENFHSIGFNPRHVNDQANYKVISYFLSLANGIEKCKKFYIYSTSIGQNNTQNDLFICQRLTSALQEQGFDAEYKPIHYLEELLMFQKTLDINICCRLHAFLESLTLGVPSFILKLKEIPKIEASIEYLKLGDLLIDTEVKADINKLLTIDFKKISDIVLNHHKNILTTVNQIFKDE